MIPSYYLEKHRIELWLLYLEPLYIFLNLKSHFWHSSSFISPTIICRHSITRYLQSIPSGIPTFSSHAEHRQHILIHTAAVFRDFSRKGFTEGMSGHISVRDPEFPDYIWMNPLGKHFGLMTAGDLICLDINSGKIVGGNRVLIPLSSIESGCWLQGRFRPRQQMQQDS
jgi:hypothetical protein